MAEIVLFHHAQGLTSGVQAFADTLRTAGHTVHTPDLYEGQTFADLEQGIGYARSTGFEEIARRGTDAADAIGGELVYAGISLGVVSAQQLAQTRPGARGAVLIDACLPVSEFSAGWPEGVPVQVHALEADPFFAEEGGDIDSARELAASTDQAELFLYPGDTHLFLDASLPGHQPAAAEQATATMINFLAGLS